MHGWIILDKPLGLGSTQAVAAVKRALRTGGYARAKVGHGGTLDPLATGVLPIALGEATKLAGRLLDSDKAYEFTCVFGIETDTLDAEGRMVATSGIRPDAARIEVVLPSFTGAIAQVPPAFSALKVAGERAYDRARSGETVALAPRMVTISALDLVEVAPDGAYACFVAHVSKGTYIRSLARDIARALGTVGHVGALRRTRAGPFGLEHAISLDKLAGAANDRALEHLLLPLGAGLDGIPALSLTPDQAGRLRLGQRLIGVAVRDGWWLGVLDDVPVALVEAEDHEVRVVRGFNL